MSSSLVIPETEEDIMYLTYVHEHQSNVVKAFIAISKRIFERLNMTPHEQYHTAKNIEIHDMSKLTPEEFPAYRANFNPVNKEEKKNNKKNFEKAWRHHYTVNKHHWEHWYDEIDESCYEIPKIYLVELICDWHAMSMKFGGTPLEYYEKNKDSIKLHERTRELLEDILKNEYGGKTSVL